jgi:hypothetical protein
MARKVSPTEVERFLKGLDYPAFKEDLIEYAQDQGAPDEVLDMLDQLEEEEFDSPVDVTRAIGDLE